jgi:tripartite-type tricarboxylate transporter receptor subunit TctC
LPELIAGRMDYAFTTALNGIPQAEAGKLRILGVPNGKRVPLLPEIPTIAESGLPGFDGVDWAAMMAPPGLPAPILTKLNAAMQSLLKEPELVAAMAARRLVLEASTPEALAEFLRQETTRWAPVVRASGARPD